MTFVVVTGTHLGNVMRQLDLGAEPNGVPSGVIHLLGGPPAAFTPDLAPAWTLAEAGPPGSTWGMRRS